nr:hypothetical protein CFP56_34894 [Quercus suber]
MPRRRKRSDRTALPRHRRMHAVTASPSESSVALQGVRNMDASFLLWNMRPLGCRGLTLPAGLTFVSLYVHGSDPSSKGVAAARLV